jgi:hypothetical protein
MPKNRRKIFGVYNFPNGTIYEISILKDCNESTIHKT